ncbi:MAG: 3-oxoacyl-ACP synthase [Candidatus Cloacimonetes bacterium 4572_65]|nr:MAG: 3-oxoacyl-ACP synthase [Candidatus Cloacimonetes bacterium 4572_65]
MVKYKAKFSSFGHYVPEKVVNNFDLEKIVDTNDEWIRTRTGMFERRIAAEDQNTSDLAFNAAKDAIEKSNVKYKDIDMIIVATISGDHAYPSTACLVQKKLGIKGIPAFDVSAGCTGFIYATNIAKQFIETGACSHILVIGVELLSRFLNWKDRNTCVLFGDGAGSAVISRNISGDISEIIDGDIEADGAFDDFLVQPAGGSAMPASEETVKENLHTVHMQGNRVFKLAVKSMYSSCEKILKRNNMKIDDIDWLISHQANMRIIQSLGKKLKIDTDNVIVNIEKYANTSAATIPIAVSEAIEEGKIKHGDVILLVSFGAGLTWGSILARY